MRDSRLWVVEHKYRCGHYRTYFRKTKPLVATRYDLLSCPRCAKRRQREFDSYFRSK